LSPEDEVERLRLLALHDRLLRGPDEVGDAVEVTRLGPLWLARMPEHGFVTYRDLGGLRGAELVDLVASTVAHYAALRLSFEWKTRGHDDAADELDAVLRQAGLVPDPAETVMIGEPGMLGTAPDLPAGLVLRRAGTDGHDLAEDVAAAGRLYRAVFPRHRPDYDQSLLDRLREQGDAIQLWLVVDGESAVCAGRVDISGRVAGLWGGATSAAWRGRGIYRALTAARCDAAAEQGCTVVYAECTSFSQPILQRAGLRAVTTTTPYLWEVPTPDAGQDSASARETQESA
jgi:GNAT superfamily N-acetyltransferase